MRQLSIYGKISFAKNSFLSSFLMNILLVWANIVLIYVYVKSKMENSILPFIWENDLVKSVYYWENSLCICVYSQ